MEIEPADSQPTFFRSAAAFEALLAGLAVAVGYWFERQPLDRIVWNVSGVPLGMAAAVPLIGLLLLVTRYPVGPLKALDELMRQTIVPLFAGCSWRQLLLLSALAGLGEELLFRGLLQAWIQQACGMPWLALAIASTVFGLCHAITSTYAVIAALIGAYLGWLWMATDNLLVPIITHAAYDFVALVYLVRRGGAHELSAEVAADEPTNKNSGPIH